MRWEDSRRLRRHTDVVVGELSLRLRGLGSGDVEGFFRGVLDKQLLVRHTCQTCRPEGEKSGTHCSFCDDKGSLCGDGVDVFVGGDCLFHTCN